MNDKNSLYPMGSIGEVALYVNGKVSTTYAVLVLGYGEGACQGLQGQGDVSLQRWNLLGVVSFLANVDKGLR
jgi:hypothetical protein